MKQMKNILEKYIDKMTSSSENYGLFLLDSPTGSGKTTAVIDIISGFFDTPISKIRNRNDSKTERIFFVTNLKKNLPVKKLKKRFGEKYDEYCLFLRPYWEDVVANFNAVSIDDKEITLSDEYKNLKDDIEMLKDLEEQKLDLETNGNNNTSKIKNSIRKYENRIEKDTEQKFRWLIKKTYFKGNTLNEKEEILKNNPWIGTLYPISNIEQYRIIIMSTKRFFLPIDTFRRHPFYIHDDLISRNSIVFIDEFDATKETLLDQIIEDGLKIDIDVIKLFLNIYYSLYNLQLPNKFFKTTSEIEEKITNGVWKGNEKIIQENKENFDKIYSEHNLKYLLKTVGLSNKKIFLFDYNREIVINKDNSRKHLHVELNEKEKIIDIVAENANQPNKKELIKVLMDIKYATESFINGLTFISENYQKVKNSTEENRGNWFFFEEAVGTMLSLFNISEEFVPYIFKKIIEQNAKNTTKYVKIQSLKDKFMRNGFEFTEVEDSNDHDLQSKAHVFKFSTTPEDIMIRLCNRAKVFGISATASLETCIGNYDIQYLKKQLENNFFTLEDEDRLILENDFDQSQKIYFEKNIKIKTEIIDDISSFDTEGKIKILLNKTLSGEKLEEYLSDLHNNSKIDLYYHFILIKLGYLYKMVGLNSDINSFLCFLNLFPKRNGNIDIDTLKKLFVDVAVCNDFEEYDYRMIFSDNFEEQIEEVHSLLKQNKKVFVLSTYKTIGMGKNIQYEIPESVRDSVVFDDEGDDGQKDFDGIYLSNPTHLIQILNEDSEKKYFDLSKYLFQQEYLRQNEKISYSDFKRNIELAFRKMFYGEQALISNKNRDLPYNMSRMIIQAVGRICRCHNKNKNVYIYSDLKLVDQLEEIKTLLKRRILNHEFKELLNATTNKAAIDLKEMSAINRSAFSKITFDAHHVRESQKNVSDWRSLRGFVLRNPTADHVPEPWHNLYFHSDEKVNGYSYQFNNKYEFKKINNRNYSVGDEQVSTIECELNQLLKYDEIREMFAKQKYAQYFENKNYIMTPSLYKKVYKGALGEVIGKHILETQLEIELNEITDHHFYEYFDYVYKNIYFDFKNWDNFTIDNIEYQNKIKNKLNKINGSKCIAINLIKRGDHKIEISKDGLVVKIPYLLNLNNKSYNMEALKLIKNYQNNL